MKGSVTHDGLAIPGGGYLYSAIPGADDSANVAFLFAKFGEVDLANNQTFAWNSVLSVPSKSVFRAFARDRIVSTVIPARTFPGAYAFEDNVGAEIQTGTIVSTPARLSRSVTVALTSRPTEDNGILLGDTDVSAAAYTIQAVASAGAGHWTLTLDRPILLTLTGVAVEVPPIPHDVTFDFGGALIQGGGDLIVWIGNGGGARPTFRNARYIYDAAVGSTLASAFGGIDVGCRDGRIELLTLDMTGSTGVTGFYSQTNENTTFEKVVVKNAGVAGLAHYDGNNCGFRACTIVNDTTCPGTGFVIGAFDVGSPGPKHCWANSCEVVAGAVGFAVNGGKGTLVDTFSCDGSAIGVVVQGNASDSQLSKLDLANCGVTVYVAAGCKGTNIDGASTENFQTYAFQVYDDLNLTDWTFTTNTGARGLYILGGNVNVRGAKCTGSGMGQWIQFQGTRLVIDSTSSWLPSDGATSDLGIYMVSGTAYVDCKVLCGRGAYISSGCRIDFGPGADFEGCTNPVTVAGGGSVTMVQTGGVTSIAGAAGTSTMGFRQHKAFRVEIGNSSSISSGTQTVNALAPFQGQTFTVRNYNTGGTTIFAGVTIPPMTTYQIQCNAAGVWEHVSLS